jgi:hypothetical protein
MVTFQFYEQPGATHFRPESTTPPRLSELLKGDAQRLRWSASALHLRILNGQEK